MKPPRRLPALSLFLCACLLLCACRAAGQPGLAGTVSAAGPPAASSSPASSTTASQQAASLPAEAVETAASPVGAPAAGGPAPTLNPAPADALDIPYIEQDPLTDTDQILRLLDELHHRQEAWFAHPGWYQKKVCYDTALGIDNWMGCMYFLVHVVDEGHNCREQMVYFVIDQQASPFEIMLADGSVAGFNLPEGSFRAGGIHPPDAYRRCRLDSLESVEMWGEALLVSERVPAETFLHELSTGGGSMEQGSGAISGSLRLWQAQAGGINVWVLMYEINAYRSPQPMFMDPATGQSQIVAHSTRLKTFDLVTGLPLTEQEILYLHNGQTVGGQAGAGALEYLYYETLPAGLAQVFADTAARVAAELAK